MASALQFFDNLRGYARFGLTVPPQVWARVPVGVVEPMCSSAAFRRLPDVHPKVDQVAQHLDMSCGCMSPPITPKQNHGLRALVTMAGMIVWNGACAAQALACFIG